jgi:ankyrin repeat protein
MSVSLPDHPNLDQLRRQAKELRDAARQGDPLAAERITRQLSPRPADSISLAAAQLVIAREHGFTSWPRLKATVDAALAGSRRGVQEFLTAAVEGRIRLAGRLLETDPAIREASIFTAAALGDADRLAVFLTSDPAAALAVDDERGWPPLLYACYTRWHQANPGRGPSMVEVARLLLDAGASPNTNNGALPNRGYRSALHGSAVTNKPGITRLLLEQGAEPNDRVSLRDAAGRLDHECLRLLLDHGATLPGTWALETAAAAGDNVAVRLLLDAAQRNEPAAYIAELVNSVLPDTAQKGSIGVVETLLSFGADPNHSTDEGPPLRQAVRAGHRGLAHVLADHGAVGDLTVTDQFLGACARADRSEAVQLLAHHPRLIDHLSDTDRAAIVEAAGRDDTAAVALMLDLGFSARTRNDLGETALHSAAYAGRAETVRLLIDRGAEIDALDANFEATPLAFATVGSGENSDPDRDWVATVRSLLDAGAARNGVWLSGGKAPSEDVTEILSAYGVTEEEPPVEDQRDDPEEPSLPNLELSDIAEHLRVAYETADLDLFASLLHPDVHWAAGPDGCTNRSQVLAWYQRQLSRGARGQVNSVEIHGDAIVISLAVTSQAEGTRPVPPDIVYQALTVNQGLIVSINGYPDLATAKAAHK